MAKFPTSNNPEWTKLINDFKSLNGRGPNDLDKMILTEVYNANRISQRLENIEAKLQDIERLLMKIKSSTNIFDL